MSLELKLTATLFLIIVTLIILYLVRKGKISIKYSLLWFIPSIILLIFIIAPIFLNKITNILGFKTASNMIFALLIGLIIIIIIALTVIVSKQKDQIRLLIQEISLLKSQEKNKGSSYNENK